MAKIFIPQFGSRNGRALGRDHRYVDHQATGRDQIGTHSTREKDGVLIIAPNSGLNLVDSNLGRLVPPMRNGKIKAMQFRDKERCPGAGGGRYFGDERVMIGIALVEDVDKSPASRDIDALMGRIIENIIGVAHGGLAGHDFARQ